MLMAGTAAQIVDVNFITSFK